VYQFGTTGFPKHSGAVLDRTWRAPETDQFQTDTLWVRSAPGSGFASEVLGNPILPNLLFGTTDLLNHPGAILVRMGRVSETFGGRVTTEPFFSDHSLIGYWGALPPRKRF